MRQQLETFDIVDDLFWPGCTGDNRCDVFVLQTPCQGELGQFEA